ncbi:hypothetical protein [Deinococcus knuensis]|uniref:Polymerase nucleotidyl transferase domain-containing protein n=1 Tax=Deinococcus knuensis TaxID=1837380 RepID=A0ABQ2SN30_9DEIO|nr:hypothetical protein [Deinococcus knuensis]GGS34786.1 hypothetical protein GCM10008961_28080 [Deinococcus knuensis]
MTASHSSPPALADLLALDERLRSALVAEARFSHVVAYGSVPQGSADAFSDLEYWAFLDPASGAAFSDWRRMISKRSFSVAPVPRHSMVTAGVPSRKVGTRTTANHRQTVSKGPPYHLS